jgi:signal transduction histidine kinase
LSQPPHDEFLELCAVSTSGELTAGEAKRLKEHLAVCPSCTEAMRQYEAVVSRTIPALAPEPGGAEPDASWSQEQAEASLFDRLAREKESQADRDNVEETSAPRTLGRIPLSASQATWRNVWVLCAAGVLLCIALGVSVYQVGIRRGIKSAAVTPASNQTDSVVALEQQVSDIGHERAVLRSEMSRREAVILLLRHELQRTSADLDHLKLAQGQLESDLQDRQSGNTSLLQQQSELTQKLGVAEGRAQELQNRVDSLESLSSADKQRVSSLENKVTDLTRLLHDRETVIDQQQEFLAHDRDIRELMGARDLYVAEVYDVERTGETKKPYGRVFYTKGKSLIFYAYDLDQQPGIRTASSFQAWGRRGPDFQQALNLGVFYVDNSSKKRWVLRFDDPKALAQIDAVFVTVEPNGGSHKPSNKTLLFAYLHIDPNHP